MDSSCSSLLIHKVWLVLRQNFFWKILQKNLSSAGVRNRDIMMKPENYADRQIQRYIVIYIYGERDKKKQRENVVCERMRKIVSDLRVDIFTGLAQMCQKSSCNSTEDRNSRAYCVTSVAWAGLWSLPSIGMAAAAAATG